jgi:hypothetical protein
MRRNRKGRPRKAGPRARNGHLRRQPATSPRAVAATMPHRRGLGDKATNQLAETELGRMALRGDIDKTQAVAGQTFARLWWGYIATLGGPHQLNGGGSGFDARCYNCPSIKRKFCLCYARKRAYLDAWAVLGIAEAMAVACVAIHNIAWPRGGWPTLRVGLDKLAVHFGLTRRREPKYQNAPSEIMPPAAG